MKAVKALLFLAGTCSLTACDEEEEMQPTLHAKWQMYSTQVLVMGGREACDFKTQPAHLYGKPTSTTCHDDDVYDFSTNGALVIHYGGQKCAAGEPSTIQKEYEQTGDKLLIEGTEYSIIMLTKDTLILDYCAPLSTQTGSSYGKVGMKLYRKKE